MTPTQYRATIEALGLSLTGAAQLLGVNERTCRRWADGEYDVPEPVAMLLRLLIAAKSGRCQAEAERMLDHSTVA